jgi:hypothetical protein
VLTVWYSSSKPPTKVFHVPPNTTFWYVLKVVFFCVRTEACAHQISNICLHHKYIIRFPKNGLFECLFSDVIFLYFNVKNYSPIVEASWLSGRAPQHLFHSCIPSSNLSITICFLIRSANV